MDINKIVLPSNKKFGFFFTLIFSLASLYFYLNNFNFIAYISIAFAIVFFILSIFNPDTLLPLNKLWMKFGLLLGLIVSPIVLGLIFFGIFTPTAFLMRLCGRDELRLIFKNKTSHWIARSQPIEPVSFKRQF